MATPNATTIVDSGIVVMDVVVGAGGGIPPLSCGSTVVRQYCIIVITLNILLPVPVAQFLTMKTMMTTRIRIVSREERACHLISYG
jgi:hypothetical protein